MLPRKILLRYGFWLKKDTPAAKPSRCSAFDFRASLGQGDPNTSYYLVVTTHVRPSEHLVGSGSPHDQVWDNAIGESVMDDLILQADDDHISCRGSP